MARLGRSVALARRRARPVVVEERKIATATISRPGTPGAAVTPTAPAAVAPISLDTLKRAKGAVEAIGKTGECVQPADLAARAGISPGEAQASLQMMDELNYAAPCCKTYYCSVDAVKSMFTRMKRWQGIV